MYYQAQSEKDFRIASGFYNPMTNKYMGFKKRSPEEMMEFNKNSNWNCFIFKDKEPIGCFVLRQKNKDEVMIGLVVDFKYQNKGYGQKMLECIEIEAKKLGVKRIKLNVFKDNTIARRIYQKAGFKEIRKEIVMEKVLK